MKQRTKQWLAAVLSAQTLTAGSAVPAISQGVPRSSVEVTQQASNEPVAVQPGVIKGVVVNPSTGKPWANTTVELLDPDTDLVLVKTRTDKSGRYDLGEVKVGRYVLRVNQKIDLEICVTSAATAVVLNVAIPTAMMGRLAGTVSWTTVGLVGAGVLMAVAVPMGLGVGGGGGGGEVSPS